MKKIAPKKKPAQLYQATKWTGVSRYAHGLWPKQRSAAVSCRLVCAGQLGCCYRAAPPAPVEVQEGLPPTSVQCNHIPSAVECCRVAAPQKSRTVRDQRPPLPFHTFFTTGSSRVVVLALGRQVGV